jgi:hypothetical protein
MEMIIISKAKKYARLDKYRANAESPYSFISHISRKFAKTKLGLDGKSTYYQPYFSFDELKDAYHRGSIRVLYVL